MNKTCIYKFRFLEKKEHTGIGPWRNATDKSLARDWMETFAREHVDSGPELMEKGHRLVKRNSNQIARNPSDVQEHRESGREVLRCLRWGHQLLVWNQNKKICSQIRMLSNGFIPRDNRCKSQAGRQDLISYYMFKLTHLDMNSVFAHQIKGVFDYWINKIWDISSTDTF